MGYDRRVILMPRVEIDFPYTVEGAEGAQRIAAEAEQFGGTARVVDESEGGDPMQQGMDPMQQGMPMDPMQGMPMDPSQDQGLRVLQEALMQGGGGAPAAPPMGGGTDQLASIMGGLPQPGGMDPMQAGIMPPGGDPVAAMQGGGQQLPPEILQMLRQQMAMAQQGGQAQGMMPPGGGMGPAPGGYA